MQLADKDFPLTKKQVQAYIDSKKEDDILAQAGDGRYCLMTEAYRFHHPDTSVFINYDLINIVDRHNMLDYYFKAWQKGLMRREDRTFGTQSYNKRAFESAGGLKAFAKWDATPLPDEE